MAQRCLLIYIFIVILPVCHAAVLGQRSKIHLFQYIYIFLYLFKNYLGLWQVYIFMPKRIIRNRIWCLWSFFTVISNIFMSIFFLYCILSQFKIVQLLSIWLIRCTVQIFLLAFWIIISEEVMLICIILLK